MQAADALRAPAAYQDYLAQACAAASAAVAAHWQRTLDHWRKEFPLPEDSAP